jgi:hypothetical protein
MTGPGTNTLPPDIATMRAEVQRLLVRGAELLSDEELETLRLQLRGHIALLIPEVEQAVSLLPRGDRRRERALTCAGEARMRLRLGPGNTLAVRYSVLHRLARSVRVLCDCYDLHTGAAMCAVCEKPIEEGDEPVPYDHVSPSAGAGRAGHVHARCVGTLRTTCR